LLTIHPATITIAVGSFYVYDEAGRHRGPLTIEALVQEIRTKPSADDVWVADERWFESPGASGWRRASEVPEIKQALAAPRATDLRMVEGAFTANRLGRPEFDKTVMMVGTARRDESDP